MTGLLVGVDETPRSGHAHGRGAARLDRGRLHRRADRAPGDRPGRGIAELVGRLAAAPVDAEPRQLCDAAVGGRLDGRDDVALIAVRFETRDHPSPN